MRPRVETPDLVIYCDTYAKAAAGAVAALSGACVTNTVVELFQSTGEALARTAATHPPRHALIVATMRPHPSDRLLEVMMVVRGLLDSGTQTVSLIIPCLPYSRSDRPIGPLGPTGLSVFLTALQSAGASKILTIDLHEPSAIAQIPGIECLDVSSVLADLTRRLLGKRGSVVLPDVGAQRRYGPALRSLNLPTVMFSKRRFGDNVVSVEMGCKTEVAPLAIILDDAVYTGTTHSAVCRQLRQLGFGEVHLVATHLWPGKETFTRLTAAGLSSVTHLGTTGWKGSTQGLAVREVSWVNVLNLSLGSTP